MPHILIDAYRLRVMWLPGNWRDPRIGDGSHYGSRWWIGLGPLLVLIGQR